MSSDGYPLEQAISKPARPVDSAELLRKIKADFVDCRSALVDIVRSRASFRSVITGNRSKLSDGSKDLDVTMSSIIRKLGDLIDENIPIDSPDKIQELRRIERTLRGNLIEELLEVKDNDTRDVDYDLLSREATSLYHELVVVVRG
ncbi:hypothetical protein TgHK011_000133 [Trichoderma gracile]|nr:hypothetical protein TgHK011_000133 [Trichoderma gracile]